MRKRTRSVSTSALLAVPLLLFLAGDLRASERTIVLGGQEGWVPAHLLAGVNLVSGRRGMNDLQLMPFSYEPDGDTELLLQFDSVPLTDAAGNFGVTTAAPEISSTTRRTGAASLLVDAPSDLVLLTPASSQLFQPGVEWGSFTLEFWLYPAVLADGGRILEWSGREGADLDFRVQEIVASIRDRRVQFLLRNFFVPPDGAPFEVILEGDEGLLPRRWSHHMLRFSAETSLLEYLVDGRTAAVTHVSNSRREDGTVYFPRTARFPSESIRLVSSFTGAIDEVRLLRRFADDPDVPQFHPAGGAYESAVIDLGSPGALLTGLTAVARTPGMTDVFLYYRAANRRLTATSLDGEWTPVAPGADFPGVAGRFVQVRAELFPDPGSHESPALSEIRVAYLPDPPPGPPVAVQAVPLDAAVTLSWAPVLDEDIRGYLVYYGTRPGRYFGTEGNDGPSPIDVGRATSITLSGLSNGTLYYFAVSAYDAAGIHSATELSAEVAARPAKVYR